MHGFLSEVISETLQTPIQTFLHLFEDKSIIFSDISMLELGKHMSIAMQNMIESPKNQLTMSKHNKKIYF